MTSGSCSPVTFKEILKKSHLITCFKTVFLIYDKQMWMSTMQCLFQIKTKNKFITWFTYFIFNSIHLCILSKLVRVWIAGKIIFIVIHMSPSYICVVWNHKKIPAGTSLSVCILFQNGDVGVVHENFCRLPDSTLAPLPRRKFHNPRNDIGMFVYEQNFSR